jgi:hypothetical protein
MSALEDMLRTQLEMQRTVFRSNVPEVFKFKGSEDLVLRFGAYYPRSKRKLPTTPLPRACFSQAYRLATRKGSKWVYVEGFAVAEKVGLVVNHAWITRADDPGEAYDLAWGGELAEAAYLGIPFRPEYVKAMHKASGGNYFSVLDAWWADYPLITGGDRLEDVRWVKP